MNFKVIFLLAVCAVCSNFAQQAEDDDNGQADDPTSDWVLPGSTGHNIKVKTTTQVKVLSSRTVLQPSQWSTLPVGEVLLVRNWPCKVIGRGTLGSVGSSADNVELSAPAETASDVTNVNVNINVDVTVLELGITQCLVQRRRNLIQRLSCSNSDQCPDSGSVCKTLNRPGFSDASSLDYSDALSDAVDMDAVPADPTEELASSPDSGAPDSEGDVLSDAVDDGAIDDWINVQQSTNTFVTVKTNVQVKCLTTRRVVAPIAWPTLPIGETILIRNRPCVITQQDAEDADAIVPDVQSDSVSVKTDVKVDVGTVLALGRTRCRVEPSRPRIIVRQGWCVCDSLKRFACKTDIECMQRWGSKGAGLRCLPTYACPIKGRTGYCRKPANFEVNDAPSAPGH